MFLATLTIFSVSTQTKPIPPQHIRIHRRQEKDEKRADLEQALEAERREAAAAAAATAASRRRALQQSLDIKTQVMARAHIKAAEAEDRVHAARLAEESEGRYLQRVASAERAIAPPTSFGRKKVEWMHS